MKRIFLTGGSGFIGSHIARLLIECGYKVTNFDNLDPLSANPNTNADIENQITFIRGDLLDTKAVDKALSTGFDAIIHCAAIAAVDRSISEPSLTIDVNVTGTLNIFEGARKHGIERVHYVSTDEVFGHIEEGSFDEQSLTLPRNPYSAGKAGGEAIALGWAQTYGMYVTITNTCNNYGDYQSPDKLIPRLTTRALNGEKLLIYGKGDQQREWIHVKDHAAAVLKVLESGERSNRYCVGSGDVRQNIEVVKVICSALNQDFNKVAKYVEDRPGHDLRYSIDSSKITKLGWQPTVSFEQGMLETINWYQNNRTWWEFYKLT